MCLKTTSNHRIKVLKFRTPRWIRFATTHISDGLGVSTVAFTQGPRDLPKDAMDLLYLSRTLRRVQSVLQRLQVEASSKVLIHGHRALQLLMHARPRIPCTPTDACESPCHKPGREVWIETLPPQQAPTSVEFSSTHTRAIHALALYDG